MLSSKVLLFVIAGCLVQSATSFRPSTAGVQPVHTTGVELSAEAVSSPSVASSRKEFLNETSLLSPETNTFAIPPEQLVERAKEILAPPIRLGTQDDGECLAENFEFCAAVVGPIGRDEYIQALASFRLEDCFELTPNFYGFSVDPLQPNRVWFFNRVQATHSKAAFLGAKPTGKEIICPPQVHHMDLNEEGKVVEYGFYTADRRQGNTGGLGGAFAFMYGVGKPLPIPECRPYKRSWQFRVLNLLGWLGRRLQKNKEQAK